jgi:hypothetical protein
MTQKEIAHTINELRVDANYYGELGKRFLSNSDIVKLVKQPDLYGQPTEDSIALLKGDYMHKRILQPELVEDIIVVDAKTRRNREYTEFVRELEVEGQPKPIFLLRREVDEMEALAMNLT